MICFKNKQIILFPNLQCPFHGKIISRDELGQPVNMQDRLDLEKQAEKKQQGNVVVCAPGKKGEIEKTF